jgi:diguanylate cyclase (GGDEF)-like protein
MLVASAYWPMMVVLLGLLALALGLVMARVGARRIREARLLQAELLAGKRDATRWAQQFIDSVLERIQDGIVVCDQDGRILEANESAARLLKQPLESLAGADLHVLAEPSLFDEEGVLLASGNSRLRTPGGEPTAVAYTSCALPDSGGGPRSALVFRNLTDEHRSQKRIRYLARYDALTRMPNRMEFQHRLQQATARARRNQARAALLYVDMDSFKDINDRFGHPIGDRALEIMARRLVDSLESGTLTGRLGGDEFAILIEALPEGIEPRGALAAIARRMLDSLVQKCHIEGHELVLSASIGIALFPDDADNVIDLIRNADAAMYHAKQNGGNTYGFYAPEMNEHAVDRLLLKNELRSAIARDEFAVLYQPKIDLRDGKIAGCEALLRWRHSRRGDVPPSVFIPLAEENTLIFEIGAWVLERVCTDFAHWQQYVPWPGRVAVNLSLRQLRQRGFVAGVEAIFRRHDLAPSCVELEITESTLDDQGERTLRTLDRLYKLGLHLSIDDFGTGYSSLTSLQHFPIGSLKIDQSFICNICEDRNSAAIAGAVIGLGRSLGMDVIAEGIETVEQLALLKRIGCTFGQGHLFGQPLTAESYLERLQAQDKGQPAHAALFQSG